ncbi:hypothetical protein N9Q58_01325 [Polaribacter sp.]|nr:hypothetical protein [Polaribacter sp.]
MKTTMVTFYVLIATLTGCSEDTTFTPTLPPITQTGANTFGCYIDGNLLVPRDGEGTFNLASHGVDYLASGDYPNYNSHAIIAHNYKENAGLIQIQIIDLYELGEYIHQIKDSNCQDWVGGNPNLNVNLHCRWKDPQTGENKYYCSIENTGTLQITRFDLPNRIVSGTFSCSAVNRDDPNDIIEITQGRFDFNWATINEKEFQ